MRYLRKLNSSDCASVPNLLGGLARVPVRLRQLPCGAQQFYLPPQKRKKREKKKEKKKPGVGVFPQQQTNSKTIRPSEGDIRKKIESVPSRSVELVLMVKNGN